MTTALFLLLWLLAPQVRPNTISGRVVLAGDNLPIANESVGLWPLGTVVRTDTNGGYIFRGVPAGRYDVIVIHDRMKATAPVAIGQGQGAEGVLLVVNPAPAITGTVFDPFGQRLASARVDAFRMVYRPTGAHVRSVMSTMTDDLGAFRLYRLPPGDHYVSASYSERDQRSGGVGYRWSANVSNADEGLPTLYFGDAYAANSAQKISLGKADSTGTSIFLKEGARFSVSGRLVGPEGDVCGRIAIVPEGGIVDSEDDFTTNGCGRFTAKGLSPGPHFLIAAGKGLASDAIPINIPARNVTDFTVTLQRTVSVRGRVSIDNAPQAVGPRGRGGFIPSGPASAVRSNVTLWRSSNEFTQLIHARVEPDGTFEIPEVGPGFFDVYVEPLATGQFVASIRQGGQGGPRGFGGQDLLTGPAELVKNTGDLSIQVSGVSATAEGVALDPAGRPVPDAYVVLLPTTLRHREDRYYATYADPGGNFRITGIAPGSYIVFAFEELEAGAYFATTYDEGVGTRWLPRGRRINFSEGPAGEPLKLSIIPATETVGGVLR